MYVLRLESMKAQEARRSAVQQFYFFSILSSVSEHLSHDASPGAPGRRSRGSPNRSTHNCHEWGTFERRMYLTIFSQTSRMLSLRGDAASPYTRNSGFLDVCVHFAQAAKWLASRRSNKTAAE